MRQRLRVRAHNEVAVEALAGSVPKEHNAALQSRRQARGDAWVVRDGDNRGAQQLWCHALYFQG